MLGVHHAAGVTKRKAKGKALSRQQRLRHERGAEKAEAVMEKREKKVERSVGKKRAGQERNVSRFRLVGFLAEEVKGLWFRE